jgi:hypothetical protein
MSLEEGGEGDEKKGENVKETEKRKERGKKKRQ